MKSNKTLFTIILGCAAFASLITFIIGTSISSAQAAPTLVKTQVGVFNNPMFDNAVEAKKFILDNASKGLIISEIHVYGKNYDNIMVICHN